MTHASWTSSRARTKQDKQCSIDIGILPSEPIAKAGCLFVSSRREEPKRIGIAHTDKSIQLTKTEETESVFGKKAQRTMSITHPTKRRKQHDANLGTGVAGIEVDQIHQACSLAISRYWRRMYRLYGTLLPPHCHKVESFSSANRSSKSSGSMALSSKSPSFNISVRRKEVS